MVNEICPQDSTNATNVYATLENKDYKQYKNSNRWYVNISWNPINGKYKLHSNDPRLDAYIYSMNVQMQFLSCKSARAA